MTYVNESALLVQVLTREQVRTLYAERMKRDFPPQELYQKWVRV